jgi:hypothetical protein
MPLCGNNLFRQTIHDLGSEVSSILEKIVCPVDVG